jgi:hypothetical protein
MTQKNKSLYGITIEDCRIATQLSYNTNTDHIGIGTTYWAQKIYYENNKEKINKYGKQWKKENKEKVKSHYENSRNSNTTRKGSLEDRIKQSCAQRKILIEDFDGFTTDQKYCIKFNEKLRIKIRNKYNNCDYISGIYKDICSPNKNLAVHHVNYDKQCGCGGNRCKLIPLCQSNHSKTNTNRFFWNRLFIYSLEYDKTYYGVE